MNSGVYMFNVKILKNTKQLSGHLVLFASLLFSLAFAQAVFADGVFAERKKEKYQLKGAGLNRIKAEHQLKFGQAASSAYKSNNPWGREKRKTLPSAIKSGWGECRDYALHKRNRCYREGREAYSCEQVYDARSKLCDSRFN